VNPAIGAANWRNGASADRFVKYDAVTFDDTLTNGTANLSGNVEPASVLVNNTTKAVTINSNSGSIVGGASLVKSGSGTLTLQGANSYSGGTVVEGGTLAITSAAALGSGTVSLQNAAFTIGALKPANPLALTGTNTITGGSGSGLAGIASMTGSGTVNLNITTGVFDLTGDIGGFHGTIRISTGNGIRMVGSVGGPGVTLDLGAGTGSVASRLGASVIEFGALAGGASTIVRGASNHGTLTTYRIGANNQDSRFAGGIQNGTFNSASLTALTKTGSGTLTLSGSNPYSGATLVSQGRLKVNGSIASSPLTVAAGAILAGSGAVHSATVSGDAILSPGDNGPGVLTVANGLVLETDSVCVFDLGSSRDRIDIGGNLTLNGIINFTNTGGLLPGTYTIFSYTGTSGGSGLTVGSVPADFGCTIDTATPGQVKVVVTTTLSAFQQWQILWFGDYNDPDAAPGADPDGDGQTNDDEFLAGTDPTSAASVATLVWRGDGPPTCGNPDIRHLLERQPPLHLHPWQSRALRRHRRGQSHRQSIRHAFASLRFREQHRRLHLHGIGRPGRPRPSPNPAPAPSTSRLQTPTPAAP
jgi:fibronectin-binding autotransporter adhesin